MTCKICDFLYNVALSLDESGNVVLFGFIKLFTPINAPDAGGAHYTISQVVSRIIFIIFNILWSSSYF